MSGDVLNESIRKMSKLGMSPTKVFLRPLLLIFICSVLIDHFFYFLTLILDVEEGHSDSSEAETSQDVMIKNHAVKIQQLCKEVITCFHVK